MVHDAHEAKSKMGKVGWHLNPFSNLNCHVRALRVWTESREGSHKGISAGPPGGRINLFLVKLDPCWSISFNQTKLLDKTVFLRIYGTENTDNTQGKLSSLLIQIFFLSPDLSKWNHGSSALRSILIRFQLMVLFGNTFPFATRLIFSNIWCSKGAAGRRGQGEHWTPIEKLFYIFKVKSDLLKKDLFRQSDYHLIRGGQNKRFGSM